MQKSQFCFKALLIVLLVSLLLTGCSKTKRNPEKEILNLTNTLVNNWYRDVEGFAKLYSNNVTLHVEDREDAIYDRATFKKALAATWDSHFCHKMEIVGTPKIVLSDDNKEAVVEFHFERITTWNTIEGGEEKTNTHKWAPEWSTNLSLKYDYDGNWVFTSYPFVLGNDVFH